MRAIRSSVRLVLIVLIVVAGPASTVGGVLGKSAGPSVLTSPAASSITLGADGWSATAIGLSWSAGPGFWYNHYYLYYSNETSSGPWTQINIGSAGYTTDTAFYDAGFSPDTTYWFFVNDTYLTSSEVSNVQSVTTALAPIVLEYTYTSSTITLLWENHAEYFGEVAFYQYSILENSAIASSGWRYLANITTSTAREYNVTGLTEGFAAAFEVQVWDQCAADCSTLIYSETTSVPITGYTTKPPPPPVIPPTSQGGSSSSSPNGEESGGFLLIVIVAVVIGVVLSTRKKKPSTAPLPSSPPVSPPRS